MTTGIDANSIRMFVWLCVAFETVCGRQVNKKKSLARKRETVKRKIRELQFGLFQPTDYCALKPTQQQLNDACGSAMAQ
jgi:hypothetical protein